MNLSSLSAFELTSVKLPNFLQNKKTKPAKIHLQEGKVKNISLEYDEREGEKNLYLIEPVSNSSLEIDGFSKDKECFKIKGGVVYAVAKEITSPNILLDNDFIKPYNLLLEVYMQDGSSFEINAKYSDNSNEKSELEISDDEGRVLVSAVNYTDNVEVIKKNIFSNIKRMELVPQEPKSRITDIAKFAKEQSIKIIDEAVNGISKDSREFLSAKMIATKELAENIADSIKEKRQEETNNYYSQIESRINFDRVKEEFKNISGSDEKIKAKKAASKAVKEGIKELKIKGKRTPEFKQAKEALINDIADKLVG